MTFVSFSIPRGILCKPCRAGISAMHHNAGVKARALIYVTILSFQPRAQAQNSRSDHRSAVLSPRHSGRDPDRARQGRVRGTRHDLDTAARTGRGAAGRRGHSTADPDRSGRDLGLDLSPRLERVEPESAAARLRARRRRRLDICEPSFQRHDRTDRRRDRAPVCAECLVRHLAARLSRSSAGGSAAAASRDGHRLGRVVGVHVDPGTGRLAAVSDPHAAAAPRQVHAGREPRSFSSRSST